MSWKKLHDSFFNKTYKLRNKYYAPVLKFLHAKGVTANHITNGRIFFIIPITYFLFLNVDFFWAGVWYLLFWLVDTVDGSLARYAGTESHKGKFYDGIIDNFMYSFVLIGFIFNQVVSPAIIAYHILIQLFVFLLAVVKNQQNKASDWFIYQQAEAFYHKLLVHVFLGLYAFLGIDMLEPWFILHNTWLTYDAVSYYLAIQHSPYKRG